MTLSYPCYHVPTSCVDEVAGASFHKLVFENCGERAELSVPMLTPALIEQIMDKLKEQRNGICKHSADK